MNDPSGSGRVMRTEVEEARAAGVPWEEIIRTRVTAPPDPKQHRTARRYLQFRSGLDPDQDQVTVQRGARILRPPPGAELTEKVLGLQPGETDFSDVTRALDEQAVKTWTRPDGLDSPAGRHDGGPRQA